MNPSSASLTSSVRRKADGDFGVRGEAEALVGVNSSFNLARRLLFERSMSPAVGLEGDIVPVAVCKLNTGGDAKRGKGTRRGWSGMDGIAGIDWIVVVVEWTQDFVNVGEMETDFGIQAVVAYVEMGSG